MSETIRLQVTQKDIDSNDVTIEEIDYVITTTYTSKSKGEYSLASDNAFHAISLGNITTAAVVRIKSDQALTLKFNGGTETYSLNKEMIFLGSFTAFQVKNNSGSSATIEYQFYGS